MADDSTPWALPSPTPVADTNQSPTMNGILPGRSYFSHLGIVRRKPSRPDAPPTLSKSCSDKLALAQCTSLLSSPVSLLISPENAYLRTLTLPVSQYSSSGCERAFSEIGRMKAVRGRRWEGGYRFCPFRVGGTGREFAFSRRGGQRERLVPSNLAAVWTPFGEETLIGGVLQGRKQFDPRGASMISKKSMWRLALDLAAVLAVPVITQALKVASYEQVKRSYLLEKRRKVKEDVRDTALQNWVQNGGEDFSIESYVDPRHYSTS
jgi:tRNA-specific adenosine deaminase 1